jgi:transposase
MGQDGQVRQQYPSALTDAQGALVAPLIPPPLFRVAAPCLRLRRITSMRWTPGWRRIVQAGTAQCRPGQPARKALRPWRHAG